MTIAESFDKFGEDLNREIEESYKTTIIKANEKMENFGKELLKVIYLVTAMGAIISIVLGIILANHITSPIKELSYAAKKIGEGDLDYTIKNKLLKRKDEIGSLAEEFSEMKKRVKADIEHIKNLERKKAQTERLSMMGQMVSGIVHEIKNPLTSISGFAQLIEEMSDDAIIKKHSKIIATEAERLNRLTRELLDYAKGKKIEIERINLKLLFEEMGESLKPKLNEKEMRINVNIGDSFPPIYVDKDKMKQVIINIISNAIEAAKKMGGKIQIEAEKDGEDVIIEISDDGPGIPEEIKDKIFMPFVSQKKGGTGLGLAMVKKIIEDHDGEIWVKSQKDMGTQFVIKMPQKPENKDKE